MSRTKRYQGSRVDYYPTPSWCVRRLLEAVELPGGAWLEPCVGGGAIVEAVDEVRSDVEWTTVDLRPETGADLIADFVALGCPELDELAPRGGWVVCVTNPPFSLALEFVLEARRRSQVVVMLLRLGWLSSARRHPFVSEHMPDVYVIPDRPCFGGPHRHGSDAADYGWMVWTGPQRRRRGRVEVLATTPDYERRAA